MEGVGVGVEAGGDGQVLVGYLGMRHENNAALVRWV